MTFLKEIRAIHECQDSEIPGIVRINSQANLQGGGGDDGGDVPDLVHLVAQLGSELDPKCDT